MSFLDKLNNNDLIAKEGYVYTKSFNEETMDEIHRGYKPEYLIVGTLTPSDGRDISKKDDRLGFFYCSKKNRLYHLIDLAFKNNDLENAKNNLRDGIGTKDTIKLILKKRKIAFLDVIKEAYADYNSTEDDKIYSYSLDEESFRDFDYSKLKKIIANSLNAYEALDKISNKPSCSKLKQFFTDRKVEVIPQSIRGYTVVSQKSYKPEYKDKKDFENAWKNFKRIKKRKKNFKYKKLISDKLALGYGSKYQLLRMLGWHRNEFNKAIAEAAGINSNINWLDFDFNGSEDKELLNLDFIPKLKDDWRNYWVCGPSGLNWDAVGITNDGTYVLVEAKAHVCELESSSKGSDESKKKNNAVITAFIKENHINKTAKDWNKNCYQLANRIIAIDFLRNKKHEKAVLVYVLFENGYEFNRSDNDSASKEEWEKAFVEELELAGIKDTKAEELINVCIFNCNRK